MTLSRPSLVSVPIQDFTPFLSSISEVGAFWFAQSAEKIVTPGAEG